MTMRGGGDGAIDAARSRIAATLEAARSVELERLVVSASGSSTEEARRRALTAADAAGRSRIVHEAREAAIAYITQAFSDRGYSGTWIITETSVSVTRPRDRAAVALALADAVTADAVEDLEDDETVEALRATWRSLGGSAALPDPSSIANLTSSLAGWSERRGAWMGLVAAAALTLIGLGQLAFGQALGVAFLAVGVVVLRNALRARSA